jgi:hypothetical protein
MSASTVHGGHLPDRPLRRDDPGDGAVARRGDDAAAGLHGAQGGAEPGLEHFDPENELLHDVDPGQSESAPTISSSDRSFSFRAKSSRPFTIRPGSPGPP